MSVRVPSGSERLGVFRGPGERSGPFKEWMHLCALGPSGFLLVNFSFERVLQGGGGRAIGRAVVVACTQRRSWARIVEPSEQDWSFEPGRAAARVAGCRMQWAGPRLSFDVDTGDGAIVGQLRLCARATPAWTSAIPMPADASLNWVVAPRWQLVGGQLQLEGEALPLAGWQAYHDHNWGFFGWADNFAWEWTFGLAGDADAPGCVVFGRLTDRTTARIFSKVLMLWWHGRQLRTFRGGDVRVQLAGACHDEGCRPVPGVAGLLLPRRPLGVPASIAVTAENGEDRLSTRFHMGRFHRVMVPEDSSLTGYRVLCEGAGRFEAEGHVAGKSIEFAGLAGLELLRHG